MANFVCIYCILKLENVQKELNFRRKKRRNGKFALISDGDFTLVTSSKKCLKSLLSNFQSKVKKVEDSDSHTFLNQIENTF